ncbi:TetR family transcriptional regulator [Actinoplanes sp. OR16]|uniref:TetR/AcrR family transcriptional regulator n=1 Tax=Actinoplanes sp. OR16 TaxID=946334 RepID=UPI000F6F40E3|nr:TetR/AcrR family transcriptional regulator [Actinoplanes sp. OR16]BBH69535.1 TetR family transcriptional regulator [Actinoplanes sp. OR16]
MTENRLDRRRARTRAALLGAARDLLVFRVPAEVSIQEITDAADVGFGSFYNHFESKQTLFEQAIAEVAAEHLALLSSAVAGLTDPAEVLSVAVRLTARFPATHPSIAAVMDRAGFAYLQPLSSAALAFLRHAHDVGRLCFDDTEVAFACVGGAVLGTVRLGRSDQAADQTALGVLRLFGLAEGDARRIVGRPLPG